MKLVTLFATLTSALLPYAAIADVSTGNPKICTSTNSQGISCKMSIRILCTMEIDDEGNQMECLNPDQDNEKPFAIVPNPPPDGYCGKKPVTIKLKVCNRNKDDPIKITDKTWIKYNGDRSNWSESNRWMAAGTCRVIKIDDEWDRCGMARGGKGLSKRMEAQLAARIIKDPKDWSNTGPNAYCYCYLFKAARTEFAEIPPVEKCETPGDFRITEVVHGKYIEIYSTLCGKKQIVDNSLYLVRIPYGSSEPLLDDAYSLKAASTGSHGSFVPADGFLLACDSSVQSPFFDCDTGSSGEYLRQYGGKDTYAIIHLQDGGNYDIIDIYGTDSSVSVRNGQDLGNNGRAVRRNEISAGISRFWQPSEWYIRLNSIGNMDPRVWQNVPEDPIPFIITEIVNPTNGQGYGPPKYIEIYTESGKGGRIDQPVKLIIFPSTMGLGNLASNGSVTIVDLQGLWISPDGFMVFCNSPAKQQYGHLLCDINREQSNLPLILNGNENVALVRGDIVGGKYEILDIFGSIDDDNDLDEHLFANCRVLRKKSLMPPQNNGVWYMEEWYIIPYSIGLGVFDPADPHQWNEYSDPVESTKNPSAAPIGITREEPTPRVDSPGPAPTPSKGKGKNKGERGRRIRKK